MKVWKIEKQILKEMTDAVAMVSDEIRIMNTPEGWDIKAVDAAHVAMIHLEIPKDKFIEYDEEECEFIIPVEKIKAFLGVAEGDILIEWENRIVLRSGTLSRSFTPIEIIGQIPKVPNIANNNIITLDTSKILMAINSVNFVDYIAIKMTNGGTTVSASGDMDSVEITYPECKTDEDVTSMYPLDYFRTALKNLPRNVEFCMENDYPLVIRSSSLTEIMYLLAPRIESE